MRVDLLVDLDGTTRHSTVFIDFDKIKKVGDLYNHIADTMVLPETSFKLYNGDFRDNCYLIYLPPLEDIRVISDVKRIVLRVCEDIQNRPLCESTPYTSTRVVKKAFEINVKNKYIQTEIDSSEKENIKDQTGEECSPARKKAKIVVTQDIRLIPQQPIPTPNEHDSAESGHSSASQKIQFYEALSTQAPPNDGGECKIAEVENLSIERPEMSTSCTTEIGTKPAVPPPLAITALDPCNKTTPMYRHVDTPMPKSSESGVTEMPRLKRKRTRNRRPKIADNFVESNPVTPIQVDNQLTVRKHIRFAPEEVIESECTVNDTRAKYEQKGDDFDKDSGVNSPQSSVQPNNRNEELLAKSTKMLHMVPRCGDIIAFKMLRLTEQYNPEISDYIMASVDEFNPHTMDVTMTIREGWKQCIWPKGKFSLELDDKDEEEQKKLNLKWTEVIDPLLMKS